MEDEETRKRLSAEFKELYTQYKELADRLKPFMLTEKNKNEHLQLLELGRKLDAKHEELLSAFGVKRIPPN